MRVKLEVEFEIETEEGFDPEQQDNTAQKFAALQYASWLLTGNPAGYEGPAARVVSVQDPDYPIETLTTFDA